MKTLRLRLRASKLGADQMDLSLLASAIRAVETADESQPKGTSWDVTIMKAGKIPANITAYAPIEALRASVDVFKGAKVYSVFEGDAGGHKKDRSRKVPREIVGVLTDPRVEGDELRATFSILPSEGWLRDNLMFLASKNQLQVYQLSVDSAIDAEVRYVPEVGAKMPVIKRIIKADLDIVNEAAAGGKFNRMVASQSHNTQGESAMKNKLLMLFTMLFPTFLASKGVDPVLANENELFTHLLQAGKGMIPNSIPEGTELTEGHLDTIITAFRDKLLQAAAQVAPPKANSDGNAGNITAALQAALKPYETQIASLQLQASNATLEMKLAASKLPDATQAAIRKQLQASVQTEQQIDDAIKYARELAAPFAQPPVNNRGMDIHAGADARDKFQAGLDGFFLVSGGIQPLRAGTEEYKNALKGVDPFRSIKEAYIVFTGDELVTGRAPQSLRASLATTDWTNVLASSMNRRLVRDYALMALDSWRAFVDVTPLNDFRAQERVRYGGYSNLPKVTQGAPYRPLVSPADEKASYTPSKYGGTESVTREMIKNDDVAAVSKIPTRMARAAAQTLHEFVYELVNPATNANIYDSAALYSSTRKNYGTAALDATGLAAARLRMRKQTQDGSAKPIGIRAGLLLIPSDLESTGYGLVTPAYDKNNNVPTFLQQIGITPVVVDYWTDATNWALVGRKEDITGIELGFVDGQEMPQMFVSDLVNAGSFFTNDEIVYKLRHEYGAAVIDFRAFDGSVVAG